MKVRLQKKIILIVFVIMVAFLITACNAGNSNFDLDGNIKLADENYVRERSVMLLSEVNTEQPVWKEKDGKSGTIDISNATKGYVAAATTSTTVAKFRVEKDGEAYNYDLNGNGEFEIFPLAMGDGTYTFTIYHNVRDTEYSSFLKEVVEVTLENEFLPFLRPNQIVNYDENSSFIEFTYELTKNAKTKEEIVAIIYHWVQNNVDYDYDRAKEVASNLTYRPDLEDVLKNKKGICYDYSALVAAMLRVNNIPCKLVMGNVNTPDKGSVYHAWNLIWLEGKGWISVKMPVTPNEWERIDLTFAASSGTGIEEFVQEEDNYVDISEH